MRLPVGDLVNETIQIRLNKALAEIGRRTQEERAERIVDLSRRGILQSSQGAVLETSLALKQYREVLRSEMQCALDVLAESGIPLTIEIADTIREHLEGKNKGFKSQIPSTVSCQRRMTPLPDREAKRAEREIAEASDRILRDMLDDLRLAVNSSKLRDGAREVAAYATIRQVEVSMRSIISDAMDRVDQQWMKDRVPGEVLKKWKARLQDMKHKGYAWRTEQPRLLDMADFNDYADVIQRSDNWKSVFQRLFQNKDELIPILHELQALRNQIAHMRGLSEAASIALDQRSAELLGRISKARSCLPMLDAAADMDSQTEEL